MIPAAGTHNTRLMIIVHKVDLRWVGIVQFLGANISKNATLSPFTPW